MAMLDALLGTDPSTHHLMQYLSHAPMIEKAKTFTVFVAEYLVSWFRPPQGQVTRGFIWRFSV